MTDRDRDAESKEPREEESAEAAQEPDEADDEPTAAAQERDEADEERDEADEDEQPPDAGQPDTHEGGKGEGRKTDVDRKPEDQRSRPDPKERSSAV